MEIKKIAIVGAGIMGSGIALDLACNHAIVILKDINQEILEKAKYLIANEFRMSKMVRPEIKGLSREELFSRIQFTADGYGGFTEADLVIESATEDWSIKEKIYRELQEVCREDVCYASNTSCISITRIASLVKKPANVIGIHFMNPVILKKAVEVIRGYHTSPDTEKGIMDFLRSIGKHPVVVNDFPGFVANRLSHLFMNEAAFLVQDGVADAEHIDLIFKEGYGHKMGPLETADLIGLDTVVNSLDVLYQAYQDPKFRCCPLLKKMVNAGLYGKKSGKGFYSYQ